MIGTPQLLISDDDRDFRETLRSVFERQGLDTILAANGQEAVEIVKNESIHVVLIDLHMPKLSGIEAIRQIRDLRDSMPCILISAALDESIQAQASEAFSTLKKPVSQVEVTQTVFAALTSEYGWQAD